MELYEDIEDYIYTIPSGGEKKWSCEGRNCSYCDVVKNIFGRSVGCDCKRASGEEPASCIHSTSGSGGGLGWVSALLTALGLYLEHR